MNLRRRPPARPTARMSINIIPFVLSYVTAASGGAASPGLGGQRTPKGKGKGKDMGKNKRRKKGQTKLLF